jgi:hypothetical protein
MNLLEVKFMYIISRLWFGASQNLGEFGLSVKTPSFWINYPIMFMNWQYAFQVMDSKISKIEHDSLKDSCKNISLS